MSFLLSSELLSGASAPAAIDTPQKMANRSIQCQMAVARSRGRAFPALDSDLDTDVGGSCSCEAGEVRSWKVPAYLRVSFVGSCMYLPPCLPT